MGMPKPKPKPNPTLKRGRVNTHESEVAALREALDNACRERDRVRVALANLATAAATACGRMAELTRRVEASDQVLITTIGERPESVNVLAARPSIEGPFYVIEAEARKDMTSKPFRWLVATDAGAVCEGNFSVLAEFIQWRDAVFVASACNRALGFPEVGGGR